MPLLLIILPYSFLLQVDLVTLKLAWHEKSIQFLRTLLFMFFHRLWTHFLDLLLLCLVFHRTNIHPALLLRRRVPRIPRPLVSSHFMRRPYRLKRRFDYALVSFFLPRF